MLQTIVVPRPGVVERCWRIVRDRKLPDKVTRQLERVMVKLGLARPSRTIVIGSNRMIVRRGTWDPQMVNQVITRQDYTSDGFSLGKDDVVVDIGANIGSFAVFAGSIARRVVSFEPAGSAFEMLSRNVALNGLGNVEMVRAAVGGHNGEIVLYKGADDAINTILKDISGNGSRGEETVPCMTLDAVFERYGIDYCDFLKLDCEGAEYDILHSASPDALRRIGRISMEYHVLPGHDEDKVPKDLVSFLSNAGFTPVRHVQYKGARCGMLRFVRAEPAAR